MKVIWGLQGTGRDQNSQGGLMMPSSRFRAGATARLKHRWGEFESVNELEVKEPTGLKNWETSYLYPWGSTGL